jgi:hypothetical protein
MQLGDDDIREFSKLWKEEFGQSLSPDEACASASTLLALYALLVQSAPEQRSDHPGAQSAASTP